MTWPSARRTRTRASAAGCWSTSFGLRRSSGGGGSYRYAWLSKPTVMHGAVEILFEAAAASRGISGYLDFGDGEPFSFFASFGS